MQPATRSFAFESGPHTWDDFLALPDDDRRELLDGHYVEMDMPNTIHGFIVMWLGSRLTAWMEERNAGIVLASGAKVRVSERRGAMPDIQVVRRGNPGLGRQGFTNGRPDVAIEIISPGSARFDRVTKLQWYASIGVPEYWIVDPEAKTIDRLVRDPDGVLQVAEQAAGDVAWAPASFPGLVLDLAKMWSMGGYVTAGE